MKANGVLKNLLFVLNVGLGLSLGYSILHAHLTGLLLSVLALVVVVGLQVWVMRERRAGEADGAAPAKNERVKK